MQRITTLSKHFVRSTSIVSKPVAFSNVFISYHSGRSQIFLNYFNADKEKTMLKYLRPEKYLIADVNNTSKSNIHVGVAPTFRKNSFLPFTATTSITDRKIIKETVRYIHGPAPTFDDYRNNLSPENKKNFVYFILGTSGFAWATTTKSILVDALDTMNPAADVLARANTEVDISNLPEGATLISTWRGKPLFIRHRTAEEIQQAEATPLTELRDPEPDQKRTKKPNILVVLGVCTHLGCVPIANQGDYKGWFCPCHGSHYDTSGRIRKGPAPKNLEVPPYKYLTDNVVIVGS